MDLARSASGYLGYLDDHLDHFFVDTTIVWSTNCSSDAFIKGCYMLRQDHLKTFWLYLQIC